MSLPTTQKQWVVRRVVENSFDGLVYEPSAPVPTLGDNDVLVKVQGASLNFRDLIIPRVNFPLTPSLSPPPTQNSEN